VVCKICITPLARGPLEHRDVLQIIESEFGSNTIDPFVKSIIFQTLQTDEFAECVVRVIVSERSDDLLLHHFLKSLLVVLFLDVREEVDWIDHEFSAGTIPLCDPVLNLA